MEKVTLENYEKYQTLSNEFKKYLKENFNDKLEVRDKGDVIQNWYEIFIQDSSYIIVNEWMKGLYIDQLFVSEKMRGKGIGTKMMNWAIDYAQTKGLECVRLGVLSKNSDAIKFYKKLKFGDESIIMKKVL